MASCVVTSPLKGQNKKNLKIEGTVWSTCSVSLETFREIWEKI